MPATHTLNFSPLYHSGFPHPRRVLGGVKGRPGDTPREIKTWSGTQGAWKRSAFVLPPRRKVQSHFSNQPKPPSNPPGWPAGTPIQTSFLQSNTTHPTRSSKAFVETGSWCCQTGTGLPTGIQLHSASNFSLSGNPNSQETRTTSLANFQHRV